MEAPKLVGVRFIGHYSIYFSGDQAGFPQEEAKKLVELGVAQYFDPTAEPELAEQEPAAQRVPATLEELEAEVKAAGYSDDAAKKIAQDRFDGVYGEAGKFLGANVEYDEKMTPDEYRAKLNAITKAELVELAKAEYSLELDANSKKDELVDAIVAAATKK
ncbi:MAG: hypothetical protein JWO13_2278 [Acidobacteriales bacterium]|nr:hypothetical protein [Terriglobales bacterium]